MVLLIAGPPVEVGVTMYVLSISSVSEVLMDFTLDFYFRQFWTDPRLAFKPRAGVETLSVGSEFIKNIWVPDTFFVNEKQSYFHIATTSNEFIRIHHSGSITRSIRLTITASCPMNLQYFPMDRQLCHIEIESFGYTMRDIRYKWNEGPNSVGVSNEVSLPQFKVLGHRQRAMEISLTTGNYSRLACEIQFVRSMGYYLIQIYIPSGLIVIISWVSFWLNRNATPARVALGVTTVLTMTTLMSSTNAALPKISYVKSIDVYLGTCFVMVFASLLGECDRVLFRAFTSLPLSFPSCVLSYTPYSSEPCRSSSELVEYRRRILVQGSRDKCKGPIFLEIVMPMTSKCSSVRTFVPVATERRRLGNGFQVTAKNREGSIRVTERERERERGRGRERERENPVVFVQSISSTRFDTHIVAFSRLRLRVPHYIRHHGTSPSRCSA
ncbi:gamma-aminobutyric acid receptor subunit beta isoform X6 [Monomorium pharaonis]|uniref:gamma-aminobutyric acid receptor subunit beta isoform X6 n=1 Tax=Monomorium pharaonis TaxID=307658 RepID=UPI001745CBE4|nr:gamma-aminobutyric acid receptor subunit beta isoform X6 [Monomorium pharaonis]